MFQICSILLIILSFLTIGKTITQTETRKNYIIQIRDDLKPTNIVNIKDWYNSILPRTNSNNNFLHIYTHAFHGFSIPLTSEQLVSLKTLPEVVGIFPDELLELHTTRTPTFLGLNSHHALNGILNDSHSGSNVVIGVLDSGIWPKSPSFNDHGLGPIPTHFKGECAGGVDFPSTLCNKKLIGVRFFSHGMTLFSGFGIGFDTALDRDGHGSHTASTMAGRTWTRNASFFEYAKGLPSGIAPKARLAIYKVCYKRGCVTSDVLAGFDKAVGDGVDIISMSLGAGSRRYSDDPMSIATFGAVDKGVFVSTSAGNSGPGGQVSNIYPWVTTVGASTIDRTFPAILQLSNGDSIIGSSIYTGLPLSKQEVFPIVHFPEPWDAAHCTRFSLDDKNVTGKIVVCLTGFDSEVDKSLSVQKSGAIGVVVTSDPELMNNTLLARPYTIPGLTIAFNESFKLLNYLNKTQLNATIIIQGTQIGQNPAPIIADFSSRGPSSESVHVLKPDVIAPGVDILAAWIPDLSPSKLPDDPRRSELNIISGTSMSCPHVSGIAALLKGSHPDWTPAIIRSALMTTAYKGHHDAIPLSDQQYGDDVSPWDIGAGHVNPEQANDPGLVYDLVMDDYIQFLCALNYSETELKIIAKKSVSCDKVTRNPWDINYPAIVVNSGQDSVVTRTLTNVDVSLSSYEVRVVQPEGANVTVEPMKLRFESKGMKQNYSVSVKPMKNEGNKKVGLITWSDGKHNVTIPLIVYKEKV